MKIKLSLMSLILLSPSVFADSTATQQYDDLMNKAFKIDAAFKANTDRLGCYLFGSYEIEAAQLINSGGLDVYRQRDLGIAKANAVTVASFCASSTAAISLSDASAAAHSMARAYTLE